MGIIKNPISNIATYGRLGVNPVGGKKAKEMAAIVEHHNETYTGNNNAPVKEENNALKEKIALKEAKVKEYLDALVNGDAISLLFIIDNLAEEAKKALLELEELMANDNVKAAREELKALREECNKLKSSVNKLRPSYEEMTKQKDELQVEVADLLKQKEQLMLSINNELIDLKVQKEK